MVEIDFSRRDSLVFLMDETKAAHEAARSVKCIPARRIVGDDGSVELELRFRRAQQN